MPFVDTFRKYLFPQYWKEDEPEARAPIKYHPEFGFEDRLHERRPKGTTVTEDEMDAVNLEPTFRNDCAYYNMMYKTCVDINRPIIFKCHGIRKEIENCYVQERIDDMKEFERERRLNARERKLTGRS